MINIINIANIIDKNGGRLYLVGGAVRDKLTNVTPHDEDYCITGISSKKFKFSLNFKTQGGGGHWFLNPPAPS